jgi:hypothetical protein
MPPCFGSPADATSKAGSNNSTATASACTLRMIPSTFFGLNRPIGIEDTTAHRSGNRPSQCEGWQFGLIEIHVAELAMICHSRFVATRLLHRNSPHGVT